VKGLLKSVTIVATMMANFAHADIMTVTKMQEVQAKVEDLLKEDYKIEDILLALDIDMTLVHQKNPAAYMPNIIKYKAAMKQIMDTLSPVQKDVMLSLSTLSALPYLIEKESSSIIKGLQKRGVKIIACTSRITGPLRTTEKFIFESRRAMQRLGFDFGSAFSRDFMGARATSFFDFPEYFKSHPFFYRGILSSNGSYGPCTKGQVLVAFLKHVGPQFKEKAGHKTYYPRIVMLVDDKKSNLEDAEQTLKHYNPDIIFIGILYTTGLTYSEGEISDADFTAFWQNLADEARILTN
jgi:hypothetical protein